jgi:hypothetical protein
MTELGKDVRVRLQTATCCAGCANRICKQLHKLHEKDAALAAAVVAVQCPGAG